MYRFRVTYRHSKDDPKIAGIEYTVTRKMNTRKVEDAVNEFKNSEGANVTVLRIESLDE
jgi:hypothetical protein